MLQPAVKIITNRNKIAIIHCLMVNPSNTFLLYTICMHVFIISSTYPINKMKIDRSVTNGLRIGIYLIHIIFVCMVLWSIKNKAIE